MINDQHDTNTRKCNDYLSLSYSNQIKPISKALQPELMNSRCRNTLKMYQGFV